MINIFSAAFYFFISTIVTLYLFKMLIEGFGVDKSDFFKGDISEDLTSFLFYSLIFIKMILLFVIDEDEVISDFGISINTFMVLSAIIIDTIFLTLVTTIGYISYIAKNGKGKINHDGNDKQGWEEEKFHQEQTRKYQEYLRNREEERQRQEYLRQHEEELLQEEKERKKERVYQEEEQRQQEERRQEKLRRWQEYYRVKEEQKRQEEEKRQQEEKKRQEEQKRQEEEKRQQEEKKRQEEQKRQEEEKRRQEEQKRQEEEKRRQEERRRRAAETEARYADILGVAPGASFAEIKKAYHQRVMEYHPDRVAGLGEEIRKVAEEKTKAINEAFAYFENKFNREEHKRQEQQRRQEEELRRRFTASELRYFAILGVEPGASFAEIKKGYRKRCLQYHPDTVAHLGEEYKRIAGEKMQAINEAYRYFERHSK